MRKPLLLMGFSLLIIITALFFMSHKNSGVPVLMYHMVSDWSPQRPLAVQAGEFELQMQYLHLRGYKVMRLEEIMDRIAKGKPLPHKAIALTFDDGYMDNYLIAFPILKKYRYPATVFIPSNLIGKENLWDIKKGKPPVKLLTRNQIEEMRQNNISFQAHSSNHVVLVNVPPGVMKSEIFNSKTSLARLTGQNVDLFCYPFGRYDGKAKNYVKAAGFKYAFTTQQGCIHYGDDPYALKRIRVSGLHTLPEFIINLEFLR